MTLKKLGDIMRHLGSLILAIFPALLFADCLQNNQISSLDLCVGTNKEACLSEVNFSEKKSGIGLSELLKEADSNYALQAKILNTEQAKKNHTISKVSFIPTLNIDYTFQNNDRDTSIFSNYNTQVLNAKLKFEVFSGFSTINLIKERAAIYRSNVADMEHTKQSIYLQVIQQYYGYFNNLARLNSLQKKLEQIRCDIARASKLYEQGLTTIDNLESLNAQGFLSEYQISDVKLSIEQNKLMLEYLTNKPFDNLIHNKIITPAYEIKERNDLTALKEQVNAQIYQNKQLNYFPTISVFNTYSYNIELPQYVLANPLLAPTFPKGQNVFGVTVTLKVLEDIGLTIQKQYMRLGQLASQKTLTYKQLEQKKDEMLYRKSLESSKAKINSAAASLKSAIISYSNIKKKYDAQLATFAEYLQAISVRFDAEATYNESLNNYEMQKANYIFYSGQKIQDYIK